MDPLAKNEIKLKTLWECFYLLWDFQTEEKKRIDQIETQRKKDIAISNDSSIESFFLTIEDTSTQTEDEPDEEHHGNHTIHDLQDNSSENIFNDKKISTSHFEQLLIAIEHENVVFMNRNEKLSKEVK